MLTIFVQEMIDCQTKIYMDLFSQTVQTVKRRKIMLKFIYSMQIWFFHIEMLFEYFVFNIVCFLSLKDKKYIKIWRVKSSAPGPLQQQLYN